MLGDDFFPGVLIIMSGPPQLESIYHGQSMARSERWLHVIWYIMEYDEWDCLGKKCGCLLTLYRCGCSRVGHDIETSGCPVGGDIGIRGGTFTSASHGIYAPDARRCTCASSDPTLRYNVDIEDVPLGKRFLLPCCGTFYAVQSNPVNRSRGSIVDTSFQ